MTVQGINPGIQDPLGVAHRKSSYFREGRYSTCLEKRKKKQPLGHVPLQPGAVED